MNKKNNLIDLLHERAKKVIPGGNSLLSKRREMFAPGLWPSFFESAKGINVKAIDGIEYKDFSHFSVGTNTLGYSNDYVNKKVIDSIQKGTMTTLNAPEEVYLAERLIQMHPWASIVKFARTGGEANSIAIRMARAYTGRSKIAFCGYHGWHDWYLSANLEKKDNLDQHLLSGLSPKGVPSELYSTSLPFNEGDLEGLEKLLSKNDVAAVKIEVMRSNYPSKNYLEQIVFLAKKYNALLIVDECTSGFRETFGGLHLKYEIEPDIAVFGKTLGNGFAITSVLAKSHLMDTTQMSFISSTYFTERTGFVAGLATLDQMEELRSWELISKIGQNFKSKLTNLARKYNLPFKVTGMDALVTFNLEDEKYLAYKTFFTQEMLKRNYLASNSFYPSICHKEEEVIEFFHNAEKVFEKISTIRLRKENIENYLDGDVCHSGFKRLN